MDALHQQIKMFVLATFPLARKKNIDVEESLLQNGIIDSLGVMEIVNYLVEEVGVEIEEDDLMPENFETITAIAKLIQSKERKIN